MNEENGEYFLSDGLVNRELLKVQCAQDGSNAQRFRWSLVIYALTFVIGIGVNTVVLAVILIISTSSVRSINEEKNQLVLSESVTFIGNEFASAGAKIRATYNLLMLYEGERDWNDRMFIDYFCQCATSVFHYQWYTPGVSQFGSNFAGAEVGERIIVAFVYNKDLVTREPRRPHLVYNNYTNQFFNDELGFNTSILQTFEFGYDTLYEYSPFVDWDQVSNVSSTYTYKNKKWYTHSIEYHTGRGPESYFFIDNVNWRGEVSFMLTKGMFPDIETETDTYGEPDSIIYMALRIDVFKDFIKKLSQEFGGDLFIFDLSTYSLLASSDDKVAILDASGETPRLFNVLSHPDKVAREVCKEVINEHLTALVDGNHSNFFNFGDLHIGSRSLQIANTKFVVVSIVSITNVQRFVAVAVVSCTISFFIPLILSVIWSTFYFVVNSRLVKEVEKSACDVLFLIENLNLGVIQIDVSDALKYFERNDIGDPEELTESVVVLFMQNDENYMRTIRVNEKYKEFQGLITVEVRQTVIEWMLKRILSKTVIGSIDIGVNDGKTLMMSWKYYQEGKYAFISYTDVTDMKKANREREIAISEVATTQKYAKQVEMFVGAICHEIRNPLHGIQGSIELLHEKGTLSKEEYEEIRECCDFQKIVLSNTIDITKVSTFQHLSIKNKLLKRLCKNTVRMMNDKASLKGIRMSFSSNIEEKDVCIKTDTVKLKQIIINLVSNAIKFTENGEIEVSLNVEMRGDKTINFFVSVKDTGIGIDPKHHKKIFKIFSQAHSGIISDFGGSGLGLYLSQSLAKLLNGKIELKSKGLGTGSTFTLSIFECPIVENDIENQITKTPPLSPQRKENDSTSKGKVIYAEDVKLLRTIAERYLKGKYEPIMCENGVEAVEALKKHGNDIQVVFLDLHMPKMNGLEACKEIRQRGYAGPVIICTGKVDQETIKKSTQAGASSFLAKPFTKQDLFDSVSATKNIPMEPEIELVETNESGTKQEPEPISFTLRLNANDVDEISTTEFRDETGTVTIKFSEGITKEEIFRRFSC